MPDRSGESRWSSARERQERDRAREAERDAARKSRQERANVPPAAPPPAGGTASRQSPRRLTDDERRTIREYRFPSASSKRFPAASPPPLNDSAETATPPAPVDDRPTVSRRGSVGTSTKWRSAVETASATPVTSNLPDLPSEPETSGRGSRARGNSRLIVFGVLLFAAMGFAAFLPFGPLGEDDDDQTPTPSSPLSVVPTPSAGGSGGVAPTPVPTVPLIADNERVVCVDPGHGGWDTGWNRSDQIEDPYDPPFVTEAELNLGMAFMLKEELEANDVTVVMTRVSGGAVNAMEDDVNDDGMRRRDFEDPAQSEQAGDRDELQARINICNEAGADVMISVHHNGFDDRSVRGYEIYYTAAPYRPFGDLSAELARLTYRELDAAMRNSNYGEFGRGALDDTQLDSVQHDFGSEEHLIMTGPGVNGANYTITPTNMPGIIVESAFLSNDEDARFVIQPENQRLIAGAYARGILRYFENHPG